LDPRDQFITDICPDQTQILHHRGFIFLCGGDKEKDEESGNYISGRGYILNRISEKYTDLAVNIELAEDIKDWWRSDRYTDLITFECDIAELSGLIVIFVESAGAIAELGAFSQLPSIQKKLLVFVDETHSKTDSFIQLGPIKFLESHFDDSVAYFNWIDHSEDSENTLDLKLIEDCADEIIDDVNRAFDKKDHSELFSCEKNRHQMFVACDLIDVMHALTIKEIIKYLASFNIEIKKKRLKQYLYVLEKFDFISVIKRGSITFYVSQHKQEFVEYSTKTKIDRQRLKYDIAEYYKNTEKEEKRHRVIRSQLIVQSELMK